MRPYRSLALLVVLGIVAGVTLTPRMARSQARQLIQLVQEPNPLLLHSGSQGYLGVDVTDVDQEKAQTLKLKEVRGALITLIDHDAPAGQIGLKVNDVVLAVNGQPVEGAEQLRRMLREIPAGRKVSLLISRDGNSQTIAVELADRRAMEHDVWNKIGNSGDVFAGAPAMGILAGGDGSLPSGFHMPFFGSTLNVGALVEPLTSQMAEYLGVQSGLMVKQVARKSEAATAGLKAFDVILKVGPEAIKTISDWDRSLHANQGKPVQVTILRDKKQQTVTLQVDSKHHSVLEFEDIFPGGQCPLVAEIDPDSIRNMVSELTGDKAAAAEALRGQAEALREKLKAGGMEGFTLTPQQAEEFRKQAEALRESLKAGEFKIDRKQLEQMKQQMEELRKSFKQEDFKVDPQQMEEFKRQMEQFQLELKDPQGPAAHM
jgi:membrane-associated protease RseP (regulator of RpoE activity)